MTGTIADLLADVARRRPQLTIAVDDERIDFRSLHGAAAELGRRLLGAGLAAGSKVALLAPNGLDHIATWMAGQLAGLEVALVNHNYPDELLDQMFGSLRPAAVLLGAGQSARSLAWPALDIGEAAQGHVYRTDGALVPATGALAGASRPATSAAGYMHTSGTTGLPKFCAQSHTYFRSLGAFVRDLFGLGEEDIVYSPLPLFHVNPLGYALLGALSGLADFHTSPRFSVSGYWPTVVRDGVTVLILHGAPIGILNRHADPEASRGHKVRASFFGDQEFMARFGVPRCVSAYGSTEAGGITHTRWWDRGEPCAEPEGQMRCAGAVRDGFEWRIEDGEILVRAAAAGTMFSGYLTAEGIHDPRDEAGWLRTGDLGRAAGNGDLVFVERAAESVRVRGEYVPLEHVETVLARALNVPVSVWRRGSGEQVRLVAFAEGRVIADRYLAIEDELPSFMRPAAIAEVAELPRDAGLGKVQRRRLDEIPVTRWHELPVRRSAPLQPRDGSP